ncbi:MAG: hypothetical protein QMD11_07390, partial [Smithella sp.]|nr:hypothetical protein [Smithella sp.]
MRTDFLTPSQAQLKRWARLDDGKIRQDEGVFLAEGVKVVEELLATDWPIQAFLVIPEKEKYWEHLDTSSKDIPVYRLTRAQWEKIGQDREPEGIMA